MQHQAAICPEHGRAVSCTGPDDADILLGQCDWGNHSVTTVSEKYIADQRAGNVRELDFEGARADRDSGVTVTQQAAVAGGASELEAELAKLPADEREQLLSAVKAANAQREADAATTTGDVDPDPYTNPYPDRYPDSYMGSPGFVPNAAPGTGGAYQTDPLAPGAPSLTNETPS